jgi:hypothetical protein
MTTYPCIAVLMAKHNKVVGIGLLRSGVFSQSPNCTALPSGLREMNTINVGSFTNPGGRRRSFHLQRALATEPEQMQRVKG